MPRAYATLEALKARLGDSEDDDDAVYRSVLEAVSNQADVFCGRGFQTEVATRYYTPREWCRLLLDIGLLAVTTLKTDEDGDRVYEVTWAATDYDLQPFNALLEQRPYLQIVTAPQGLRSFPCLSRSVEIAGKWGFFEDLFSTPTTLSGGVNASTTTMPVTTGHGTTNFQRLQTIQIDDEQMYVTAIAANDLTVERGVNGTTAASHLAAAAIRRHRYPGPVVEAVIIQAARLFRRKDTPFGVVGGTDLSFARNIPTMDPDVSRLLSSYVLPAVR